jgi:hypothetical protein
MSSYAPEIETRPASVRGAFAKKHMSRHMPPELPRLQSTVRHSLKCPRICRVEKPRQRELRRETAG